MCAPFGSAGHTCDVAGRRQTSVELTPRAFATLATISEDWGISRNATIVRLLTAYVERQHALNEDTRLVHISTVLRYPRRTDVMMEPELARQRLALRIEPGLEREGLEYAFRIPGQAWRQAHRDYAGRPLTDAITTAIAMHLPFEDRHLEDLPPLLQHSEALGLWRLTIAATRTDAEREVLDSNDEDLRRHFAEGTTAWLSSWRYAMALHLARRLFIGPADVVTRRRRWIGGQGDLLEHYVDELENRTIRNGTWLTEGAPIPHGSDGVESNAGRGATVVWRAKRQVALEEVAVWFTSVPPTPQKIVVGTPGWEIARPAGWYPLRFPGAAELPKELERLVAERRVLRIDHLSSSALWPVDKHGAPIPGFRDIIEGAGRVSALELAEATLVHSRSWYAPGNQPAVFWPGMHPDTACELGFIDRTHRDSLITSAEEKTRSAMERIIAEVSDRDPDLARNLEQALTQPTRFARLARHLRPRFSPTRPIWHWKIGSVKEALDGPATAAQLQWLGAGWLHVVRRSLGIQMELAWRAAFHGHVEEV